MDTELILSAEPADKGKTKITAKLGDTVVAVDVIDLSSDDKRKSFAAQLTKTRPGIDADAVAAELLQLAGRDAGDGGGSKKKSVADLLIAIANEAEHFHDDQRNAFARIKAGDHFENHRVESKPFKLWLTGELYRRHGKPAYAEALSTAINTVAANAIFHGERRDTFFRIANVCDAIYIDLADEQWRAVKVTADGWSIDNDPPVRFIRSKAMKALPVPTRGGSVEDLRGLLNVGDDGFTLIVAWLVAALRGQGPYPLLNLAGEMGTAKSTTARLLRSLTDPNAAPLRSEPKDARDLVITASNAHVLSLDNLSHVPVWMSDGLCRLSTGGGYATRALYTDDDERIFDAMRPLIVNGIEEIIVRSDLLDRAINVQLTPIPKHKRRTEAELQRAWDAARPAIFGALLDAVAAGLANFDTVRLKDKPRMADFALWVTACEPGLGWTPGRFMDAYVGNQDDANLLAIESSPIGATFRTFAEQHGTRWTGTASELLDALEQIASDRERAQRGWPKTPSALSGRLKRIAPNLRKIGIDVQRDKDHGGRQIIVEPTRDARDGDDGDPGNFQKENDPDLTARQQAAVVIGAARRHDRDGAVELRHQWRERIATCLNNGSDRQTAEALALEEITQCTTR